MDGWNHFKYFLPKSVQIDTKPIVNDVIGFLPGGHYGYHKEQSRHSPSFSELVLRATFGRARKQKR